jgi:hypothetical protein
MPMDSGRPSATLQEKPSEVSGYEALGRLMELILYLPFLIMMIALRGYVLHYLWEWFILPTFNVPTPSVLMCVALSMTCAYLFLGTSLAKRGDTEEEKKLRYGPWQMTFTGMLLQLAIFGIGYLLHRCM